MSTDETRAPRSTGDNRPLPSWRTFGLLAAAMLSAGILAGAALGPSPESSLADASGIVQRALVLLAARAAEHTQPLVRTTVAASASSRNAPTRRTHRAHIERRIARSKPKLDLALTVPVSPSRGDSLHKSRANSRDRVPAPSKDHATPTPVAPSSTAPEEEASKEGSANGLNCLGHISAGVAELGSGEQQVRYTFYCNGPITGYSLESNVPLTGYGPQPIVANDKPEVLSDTFSCGGELPGWADNCIGATKLGWENVTGQFSIGAPLCAEPRVDPLLTVTDIYLEKGVPTQGISGPFDLGRPLHCPKSKTYPGGTRLEPLAPKPLAKANKHKKAKGKAKGTTKRK